MQVARSLHFLVMVRFVSFIVVRVGLVFTTGMRANLNHMYAARNDRSWAGFWVFTASMVVLVVGWVAATPFTLEHPRIVARVGYALIGPLQRLFEHLEAKPVDYSDEDSSPYFWHNANTPKQRIAKPAILTTTVYAGNWLCRNVFDWL